MPIPSSPPLSKPRIIAVLALIILFSEIATFEILMVLPALPHMAAEFRTLDIAWAASIVTLAGATAMPLIGKAADKWGKKRTILAMAVIFVLGSILCAVTTSFPLLLAGRAMQGVLVGVVSVSYGLVRDIMPRTLVPVALGAVVTGVGMSAVAGPFLAGWLIDGFGFRSVFWFLAAYVIVLLPLYLVVVPESPVRTHRPIDYLGVALLGPGVMLLLLTVSKGKVWGWTAESTLTMGAAGAAMLAAFFWWQSRAPHPLIDLRILTGPKFGLTVVAVACVGFMMSAHSLLMPIMLQTQTADGISYAAGLSATSLAVWTCPLGITAMAMGPAGGAVAKRFGARRVLLTGGILFLAVMLLGSTLMTLQWQIGILSALAGAAVGFLHSSNANLIQDALPSELSGTGASISGMFSMLAGGTATTLTGVILSGHVASVDPATHAAVYSDTAFRQAFLFAGTVGLVGVALTAAMKHGRGPAQGGLETGKNIAEGRVPAASPLADDS